MIITLLFWRQAVLLKSVATIFFQFTDSRQKLAEKGRQFATATVHFYSRQSDVFSLCFLRQRRRYQAAWYPCDHANKHYKGNKPFNCCHAVDILFPVVMSWYKRVGWCVGASLLFQFSCAKCESWFLSSLVHRCLIKSGDILVSVDLIPLFLWRNSTALWERIKKDKKSHKRKDKNSKLVLSQ